MQRGCPWAASVPLRFLANHDRPASSGTRPISMRPRTKNFVALTTFALVALGIVYLGL